MSNEAAKLFLYAAGPVGPFLIWGLIYLAVRHKPLRLRPLQSSVMALRVVSWALAMILVGFKVLGNAKFNMGWFLSPLTFSLGLVFAENWLKKKSAHLDDTADGIR